MSEIKPTVILKPWGCEKIWGDIPNQCLGKILYIKKGHRLSRQFHEEKEEVIHVIDGILYLEIGCINDQPEEVFKGLPGFTYHIKPGVIHRFCAIDGDVVLAEISTYFPKDVVRLDDDYKR